MRIHPFIQKNAILLIILVFLILQAIMLRNAGAAWWDEAVYLGMGKSIFSGGAVGLWEPARPVVWPLVLGLFWRLGLDAVLLSRILTVILWALCVLLSYRIGSRLGKHTGLIAAAFLALSPLAFLISSLRLTEIPSTFLVLLGVDLFMRKRMRLCGLVLGLAFMTRFFSILAILPVLILAYFQARKAGKGFAVTASLGMFFLIPLVPYLAFNLFRYGNALQPFITQAFLSANTGWPWNEPWHFYLTALVKDNFLVIFLLPGLWFVGKEVKKGKEPYLLVLLLFLFTFFPYNLVQHKEPRFLVNALPFIAIIAAFGLERCFRVLKKRQGLGIGIAMLAFAAFALPQLQVNRYDDRSFTPFYSFAEAYQGDGLWVSNPKYVAAADVEADLVYYPTLDSQRMGELNQALPSADAILLNACDIPCPPAYPGCEAEKQALIQRLEGLFKAKAWSQGDCSMFIFSR
ncbi:MAG: glycosyltransferase family 39 protein [Nanoarchaeota archaeon]